jgi:hypothetical protein
LCTKITAGDPLGWSEKSPALGLEPLTLGIQGQRLHHSTTEPLFNLKVIFNLKNWVMYWKKSRIEKNKNRL